MSRSVEESKEEPTDPSEGSFGFVVENPISRVNPARTQRSNVASIEETQTAAQALESSMSTDPGIIAPARGGVYYDGKTVWTGGNPADPDREMATLSCLRPELAKELVHIKKEATQGLESDRRLGMPGVSANPITFATWMRYVTRHLQEYGMDSIFYIPKKGTTTPHYYICADWGKVTMEDADTFLKNPGSNLDRHDKQNLHWSGKFLQDSMSLELWTAIEPDIGLDLNGVRVLVAVIRQYRATASITIRNLTNQLMEMSLAKTPGENVETLSNKIFDIASQIEGLGEAPRDLASLVAARFLKSSSQAFCAKAMSIFEKTESAVEPLHWSSALQQLKAVYATLKGQNMWDAIEPPPGDSALIALQKEVAELKRRGKQDKDENGKSEGGTSRKTNIIKSTPAPKEGESQHKTIDGKECSYCSKCRRWTFGDKRHTTEEHRSAAEIKAAKKQGDSETANTASENETDNTEKGSINTLSMSSGFLLSSLDNCKLCADF